jgi:hypothetical protein
VAHDQKSSFSLPLLVVGPVDLGRLIRELDTIDDTLVQLGLRKGGGEVKMPKTSQLMDKLIEMNRLNLLKEADRKQLQNSLVIVRDKAPVLHISFSADPSVGFLEKLMAWLRKEIHPLVLVTVGLQPSIGAGCIIRSTNKQFDLSLRQDFKKKQDMLRDKILEATLPEPATEPHGVPV